MKFTRRPATTTVTTTMMSIHLLRLLVIMFLCVGDSHGATRHHRSSHSDERHRQRRQKQHEQRQMMSERKAQTKGFTIPPIHVLDDVPQQGMASRFTTDDNEGFEPQGYDKRTSEPQGYDKRTSGAQDYAKRPTRDKARPLTPGDVQVVYVSFVLEGEYFVTAVNENDPEIVTEIGPYPVYVYTPEEQAQIIARLQDDYAGFPVEFVTFEPTTGPYATLSINTNTFLEVLVDDNFEIIAYTAVLFGEADWVDFLNEIADDSATIDSNFWNLLVLEDDVELFYSIAGVDPEQVPIQQALSQVMITSTANTAAHELGHLLGLRHFDSIGAPGDGLPDPNVGENLPLPFVPEYPGPFSAVETFNHLLASGASVGLTFEVAARVNRFFSERSALKLALAFASDPPRLNEADFNNTAPPFELPDIIIPNTIDFGENAGTGPLIMQASLVKGRINAVGEIDSYTYSLEGNRFVTAEVVSVVDATQFDDVITRLQMYQQQSDGSFQLVRESYQEIESFDPAMLDVPIQSGGVFQFRVDAPRTVYVDESGQFSGTIPVDIGTLEDGEDFLIGDYQLLIYSYQAPLEQLSPTTSPGVSPPSRPLTRAPVARPPTSKSPAHSPHHPQWPPKRTKPPSPPQMRTPYANMAMSKGNRDPFVFFPPKGPLPGAGIGQGVSEIRGPGHKGYYHQSKSSKKMGKSSKKMGKSSKKMKSSKNKYFNDERPTHKGSPNYKGASFGNYKGRGHMMKVYGHGKGMHSHHEPPNHYVFYDGNGKGNRGIDVFVFGA